MITIPESALNGEIKDSVITQSSLLADTVIMLEQLEKQQVKEVIGKEITGEQLLKADIQQIPFLLENILQQVGLACLAGSSDTGKSCLLRQLAVAISAGEKNFLGFQLLSRHRSVLFVSTEDYKDATAFLLRKQAKIYQHEQLQGLRFLFDYENLYSDLNKSLTIKPADLVIIDCFQDVFGGNLTDTQKIRSFLHPFQQLAENHQCLFLFLHHTGKRTENIEPSKNNLLSGQGFEAKMRLVIELRADLLDANTRHLCIVKGNYLPGRFKKESFVLEFNEQDFTFKNTGERMPFELLIRQANEDNSRVKYEQAKELKEQHLTYEQIASVIGYNSKGSVTKLFDKAKRNGWDQTVSDGNQGNVKETNH